MSIILFTICLEPARAREFKQDEDLKMMQIEIGVSLLNSYLTLIQPGLRLEGSRRYFLENATPNQIL